MMPDATFGVDTGSVFTDNLNMSAPSPGGWSPRRGRFNRFYFDAGDGATAEARNTYSASNLKKLIDRCEAGMELGWFYIHRVMAAPTGGNIGPAFAADLVADLHERLARLDVVPITPTQADSLTYERSGDIYMDALGLWRSRTTGKIAI
jgi:hypothetical protein